jgi:hypothetical protein
VERELEGAVCLYTNGAAGDVNSVHVTTHFEEVQSVGEKLGRTAVAEVNRLRTGQPIESTSISVCADAVALEPRFSSKLSDTEQETAALDANTREHRLARKLAEGPIRAEVQAMRLGPVRWVSLPGEAFVETGLELKRKGASFVVAYANGWVGYLPIRRAYDEGGYETDLGPWSRVMPGSAERLEEVAEGLLARLDPAGL